MFTAVEEFLISQPGSSPYHHPAWWDVYEKGFGLTSHSVVLTFDQNKVGGVFPLFFIQSPYKRLVSVPYRDRGGIIAEDQSMTSCLLEGGLAHMEDVNARYLKLRFMRDHLIELYSKQGAGLYSPRVTSIKKLDSLGGDILAGGVDPSLRRALRKTEKENLGFRDASSDAKAWDDFYEMFLRTRKRLGVPVYPRRFIKSLAAIAVPAGICKLFLVEKDGLPVAGGVFMVFGKNAIYAYGASDPWGWQFRPNDYLFYKTLQWCVENGVLSFDFGADERDQTSLLRFKAKWGVIHEPAYEAIFVPNKAKNSYYQKTPRPIPRFFNSIHKIMPLWAMRLESSFIFNYTD
jgi:hypothetical protein